MSEQNKPIQETQEIDLGHVFSYIEKIFKKIAELFSASFKLAFLALKKTGIVLLILLNTFSKHFFKIMVVFIIGFIIPYLLDRFSEPIYGSSILLKQNYTTGKVLYDNIQRYHKLSQSRDSLRLSQELGLSKEMAGSLREFNVEDLKNQNQLISEYNAHIMGIDSIYRYPLDVYVKNIDKHNYPIQEVTVLAANKDAFDSLSSRVLKTINSNPFFIKERDNKLEQIKNQISSVKKVISKSDTLQSNYFDLLEKYYGLEEEKAVSGTVNLNLSNTKDRISTKEFELFKLQTEKRNDLNALIASLSEKQNILELQRDFGTPVRIDSPYKDYIITLPISLLILSLLFFLFKDLNLKSVMREYGNKKNLME